MLELESIKKQCNRVTKQNKTPATSLYIQTCTKLVSIEREPNQELNIHHYN